MRLLVTSALPYANGDIHLGHLAGAYLPADIFVRYHRLKGNDVIHICGTDEHGVPVTISADKQNKSPQEIVDHYYRSIKDAFTGFGIHFDNFSRTTLQAHHHLAQDFFQKIYEKGYIYEQEIEQYYCQKCKRFLPDRYVVGKCPRCATDGARGDQCENCGRWLEPFELINPRCLVCGELPQRRGTKHWYFKLSAFQQQLRDWIDSKTHWKEHVLAFVNGWLKEGLQDRPITRDMSWGVPVPLEDVRGKVLYVWFDAPIGYISSTREWAEKKNEPDKWRQYWCGEDTRIIHFIGKDNIVFHALIWPAMLMAYGDFALPSEIPANQFLTLEGDKLSTSKGHAIWLPDYLKEFDADSLRYALTRNAPEIRDADFTWRDFQAWHNNELADILGNFVNRTLTFIHKYYSGMVPTASAYTEQDNKILQILKTGPSSIGNKIESFEFKGALQDLMKIVQQANRYFDHEEPWVTRRTNPLICERTMFVCMKIVTTLAVLAEPFLPFAAEKIKKMINFKPQRWDDIGIPRVAATVNQPQILFKKIDDAVIDVQISKLRGREISIEEFEQVKLKTAKIIEAQAVEGSKTLIRCMVEVGAAKRQIVAGVGKYYKPDDLIGKTVIIVENLKPAKIKGVLSQGMLLAAVTDGDIVLLTTDRTAPSGSAVQ